MPIDVFRGPPQLQEWQRQAIGQIPYVGPLYNALRAGNQLVKWGQQLTGNLPANQALSGNDPDYNNSNYIGLGDPVGTPDNSFPASPAAPAAGPVPGGGKTPPGTQNYNMPGVMAMWKNYFPGSALARFAPSGTVVSGPPGSSTYIPFSKLITHGGIDGGTSAFEQYVAARYQK